METKNKFFIVLVFLTFVVIHSPSFLFGEAPLIYEETSGSRPGGNEHPDDNESVAVSSLPAISTSFTYDPVGILLSGYHAQARTLIDTFKKPTNLVGINFDPETILKYFPILIIPSGGLFGLDNSYTFRKKLADYVSLGGVIICFTQQHGYEFNALPGGEVSGYGWTEDQSCSANAVYIDYPHIVFSGQTKAVLSGEVDGYFSKWSAEATILMRRTKNAMPAMLVYPYGKGKIVVTSLYTDWSYGRGSVTLEEKALFRDLLTWAKDSRRCTILCAMKLDKFFKV